MSTQNIRFYGEIMKIIPKLSSNTLLICFNGGMQLLPVLTELIQVSTSLFDRKNPKSFDTGKFAVITLKYEQGGFTVE